MEKPWSLYNKEEKLRIDDLKSEHVRIILLAIPTAQMTNWYACQEGDLRWQAVGDIPEFYEDVRQIKGTGALPPPKEETEESPQRKEDPRRPLFEDSPDDSPSNPTLQVDFNSTKERRTARRYPRKLMFKVLQGGKSFQSETVDVSMSGLSIEQQLPNWIPKTFHAELELNKTNIRVLCTRVNESKLKIMESDSWDVIRKWIVNW